MKQPRVAGRGDAHLALLHDQFLALVPRIRQHGHVYFRHQNPDKRDELIAEMVGLCWRWFLRLAHRGKDATRFPFALAGYAARAVSSGRRVCGMDPAKDVLSPRAQRTHGFAVGTLPDHSTLSSNPLAEALIENTATPIPEQVSFRLDFPGWRQARSRRDRRLIDRMLVGERTLDLSQAFGLSPARVSQLRREFQADWQRFHGDGVSTGHARS